MIIEPSKRLQSIPAYAAKEINDRVEALRAAGVKAIDFGVGDPSEPTPDFVIEALCEGGNKHATSGYPSYVGMSELRQAAADYMQRRFNVQLDPVTEICSNIGSKEAIFNFHEGFINPGDIVICPSPGYPPMKTGTIFAEGVPYYTPLLAENNFLLDFQSIPEKVAKKAKIIWVNYPNSPTGAVANREYYEKLIEWAKKYDIIIAADEGCYIDIYFDQPPMSILEVAKEGIVAFYSLSKRNNMTGYRVGFVAGDKAIIDVFKRLKTNIDSGTPNFVQEAAIAALKDDSHIAKMREMYKQKRDVLFAVFRDIGLQIFEAPATFYVWQKAPAGMDGIEFAKRLLEPELGIVVTPGSLLSDTCEGGINPGKDYVRFALMPTIDEVQEAAKRLRKHFHA